MFLNEYYFGQSSWISIIRLFGGPLILYLGLRMYQDSHRIDIAYGGFCLLYGFYYTLKPLVWILSRLESFKSVDLSIRIVDDKLQLKDTVSESEIQLDGFQRILKRKNYYAFEITKFNKIYLPFTVLTEDQMIHLDTKLKK